MVASRVFPRAQCSVKTKTPAISTTLAEEDTVFDPETKERLQFRLLVTTNAFIFCWWMVFFFQACDIAFLVCTTRLYDWLLNDIIRMRDLLNGLQLDLPVPALKILFYGFAVVAGLQLIDLLRTMFRCLKAHRLVFSDVSAASSSASTSSTMISASSNSSTRRWHPFKVVSSRYQHLKQRFIRPFFAIDGEFFDDYFLVHEWVEVLCQVYQAQRISVFVATRWINNVVIGMIFFNCASSPLVRWLVHPTNRPLRRLVNVSVSAFLNFVNSVVIPVAIFVKYWRAYDPDHECFEYQLYWDDVWLVMAMREIDQLIVTSYIDFVTTLLPHWSLLRCLMICKSMVQRCTSESHGIMRTSAIAVLPPPNKPLVPSRSTTPSTRTQGPKSRLRNRIELSLHTMLWVSGVVVLGIHVTAQQTVDLEGCRLQVSPWFGVNSSCVVLNVNCYRREIDGQRLDIERILVELNRVTLYTLVFTHCPKLQIPDRLREFHGLNILEVYNSTLDQWPRDASLHQTYTPEIQSITISRSILPTIPDGMLDQDSPSSLGQILIYQTKVPPFPDMAAIAWRNVLWLWCEYCELKQVPSQFAVLELVLPDNSIESISFDVFAVTAFNVLDLSGNPVTSLPAKTNASLSEFFGLGLEHTQVTEVPLYLRTWFKESQEQGMWAMYSLFGSPYCNKTVNLDELEFQQVVCEKDHGMTAQYPIDQIEPQRPL